MTRWRITRADTGETYEPRVGANSEAHAARMAASAWGLPQHGSAGVRLGPDDWTWPYGGVELRVHRIRARSGRAVSHAATLHVLLDAEDVERLERLSASHGGDRSATVRALIREAAKVRK